MIIPTLWHKVSASYIIWVVKNKALLDWHLAKTYHNCLLLSGSRPVDGSSRKTILGSPTRDIATDNLLFMPPDKERLLKLLKANSLTYSIAD